MQSILINDHCLERWNERVGPPITMSELEEVMQSYCASPRRLHRRGKDVIYFDEEIVGLFEPTKDYKNLRMTTFLGRVSQNHMLCNAKDLMRFVHSSGEKPRLGLREDILKQQAMPEPSSQMVLRQFDFEESSLGLMIKEYYDTSVKTILQGNGFLYEEYVEPNLKGLARSQRILSAVESLIGDIPPLIRQMYAPESKVS